VVGFFILLAFVHIREAFRTLRKAAWVAVGNAWSWRSSAFSREIAGSYLSEAMLIKFCR
jgi:hypothetical protein